MLIGFGYFPGYLWLGLFAAKGTDVKNAFTRVVYARNTYVKN